MLSINLFYICLIVASLACFSSCGPSGTKMKQENAKVMIMKTPESIESEHTELHHQLEMATNLPGQTGVYAKEVARLLHPHFVKEEEFALPPLALLPELAKGNVTNEMKKYIPMCDTLKKDWPVLLEEHAQIEQKLDLLQKAAVAEKQDAVVKFAEDLKVHAKTEEEILYPTAILIGDYLKMKLAVK